MKSTFSKLKKGDKFRLENDPLHVIRMVVKKTWRSTHFISLTSPGQRPKVRMPWKKDTVYILDEGVLLAMDTYKEVLKIRGERERMRMQWTFGQLRNHIAHRTGMSIQETQEAMEQIACVERNKMQEVTLFSML